MQVQLWTPTAEGGQALQTFKLYCQVQRGVKGGAGLNLHSGIKLLNNCALFINIGMQQCWPGGGSSSSISSNAWTSCMVAPGCSAWLPALCCNATYFSLQPAGQFAAVLDSDRGFLPVYATSFRVHDYTVSPGLYMCHSASFHVPLMLHSRPCARLILYKAYSHCRIAAFFVELADLLPSAL